MTSLTLLPPPGVAPGDGGGHGLWMRDDSDEYGGSHQVAWDLRYRPGPPRNDPLVHILPSRPGPQAGHPAARESKMSLTW